MKKLLYLSFLGLSAGVLAACSHTTNRTEIIVNEEVVASPTVSPVATPTGSPGGLGAMLQGKTVTIDIDEQNDSGQSGSARLEENADGDTVVTLTMTGGDFTQPQPAHIHVGQCPTPGAVKYPLSNVIDGASTTTINVSLNDLLSTQGDLALNVHESQANVSNYTACGNVQQL